MFKVNNENSSAMRLFCSRVDIDLYHRFLANIYLFKVNNRDSRIAFKMCKVHYKDIRTRLMTSFWCLYS